MPRPFCGRMLSAAPAAGASSGGSCERNMRRCLRALSAAGLLYIGQAVHADDFPVDCNADAASFDPALSDAIALINNNLGTSQRLFVTGNCVSTSLHELDAAGSLAIIGTGSGSASVQINNGDGLLKVLPASGTVDLVLTGMTLTGAHVDGVIKAEYSSLYVRDVVFSQNDGGYGGGIEGFDLAITIRGSNFSNNNSTTQGGAIATGGASGFVDIEDTTFADNSASPSGGGAVCVTGSNIPLRIATSLFRNNQAAGDGGAIEVLGGNDADIRNVTFVGNTAANGGAIAFESTGSVVLNNVTISGNSASTAGSAFYTTGNALSFANTLISGTCAGVSSSPAGSGNIESPGNSCALPSGNLVNEPAANLMLGALADNGGPTQTMLPSAGSVLVDNGAAPCEPIDQRHLLRNVGACDVGAVEVGASTPDTIFANGFD